MCVCVCVCDILHNEYLTDLPLNTLNVTYIHDICACMRPEGDQLLY